MRTDVGILVVLPTYEEASTITDTLVRALRHADLAIGSWYVPGGVVLSWPRCRVLLSRAANASARRVLGLRTRDCTSGYSTMSWRIAAEAARRVVQWRVAEVRWSSPWPIRTATRS